MIEIDNRCTACGACAQVCPTRCISMEKNAEGFVYPIVDTKKCIHCEKCKSVCQLEKKQKETHDMKAYAVINSSKKDLKRATSGGAFSALAKYVLKRNGTVYGCAFKKGLTAEHIRINDSESLSLLNGSKYVQSSISNTYLMAEDDLRRGLLVLFSGTPCQIAGLRSFLKQDYENLIAVDIVCHGVAPQFFFDNYVRWIEDKENVHLSKYDFRSKENFGWSLAGISEGFKDNGRKYKKKIFYFNEYYYYYFLKGYIYRECCYSCDFASLNRPGDFSLGDLWGAQKMNLPFNCKDGCSLVLVNNNRAQKILDECDVFKNEIPLDMAVKNNKQLSHPSIRPENRDRIVKSLSEKDGKSNELFFKRHFLLKRLKAKLKYYIVPIWLHDILLKMLRS